MAVHESVLIVEDESEWRAIYRRAAQKQGFATIEEAATLEGAKALLRARKYGVAFVDIGLDVDDDSNVDGLRVMELIRSLGDETSIIVVTGRSGPDVVEVTRDALKKHNAFDTVSKATVAPAVIQQLLAGALAAFHEKKAAFRPSVTDVLRGSMEPNIWDDQMLRATKVARGVEGLHAFVDALFARFLPVVARPGFAGLRFDSSSGVAHAAYWSRATGQAIAIVIGAQPVVEALAPADGKLLGLYEVGEVLNSATSGEVAGIVYAIADGRDSFAD